MVLCSILHFVVIINISKHFHMFDPSAATTTESEKLVNLTVGFGLLDAAGGIFQYSRTRGCGIWL